MVIKGKISDIRKDQLETIPYLLENKRISESVDIICEAIKSNDPRSNECLDLLYTILAEIVYYHKVEKCQCSADFNGMLDLAESIIKIYNIDGLYRDKILTTYILSLGLYTKGVAIAFMVLNGNIEKDFDEAIDCFNQSIELEKTGILARESWIDMGEVYIYKKLYQKALNCFDNAEKCIESSMNQNEINDFITRLNNFRKICNENIIRNI